MNSVKILKGREGDIVLKAPRISQKLIVLKGLKSRDLSKFEAIIVSESVIREILARARVKELPNCIVVYNADIVLQQVASELFNVELDVISNVKERNATTVYYSIVDYETTQEVSEDYSEVEKIEAELAEYIEQIEKSFEVEEEVEEEEEELNVVEVVEFTHVSAVVRTVPLTTIEVEGEDIESEIPVEILRTKPRLVLTEVEKRHEVVVPTHRIVTISERVKEFEQVGKVKIAVEVIYEGKVIKTCTFVKDIKMLRDVKKKETRAYVTISVRVPPEYVGKRVTVKIRISPVLATKAVSC